MKFAPHIFRDVATDAAFLFRHTTAMNDAAARDTGSSDAANFRHEARGMGD